MSTVEPPDPELVGALSEAITLWGTPGLLEDPDRPDLGALALLALVPTITVQTRDEHPGAELIDIVASSLLGSGFGLLARLEPADLAALPLLADCYVELDPDGRVLRIVEPTGTLYDGDLGPRPPTGWHDALRHRGRLIMLFGSAVDIGATDREDRLDQAAGAGGLVGAQLPLRVPHAV